MWVRRAVLRGVRGEDAGAGGFTERAGVFIQRCERLFGGIGEHDLAARREEQDAKGWQPVNPRKRKVSTALKAYAKLATSAAKGAVRQV